MRFSLREMIHPGVLAFSAAVAVLTFCLVLKPVAASYAVCADASDVTIDGKAAASAEVVSVSNRTIVIKVVFESMATDYRISEDPNFAGAEWRRVPGFERPAIEIKYTLSEGNGIKTIYFQARRNATIASVIKLQVNLS